MPECVYFLQALSLRQPPLRSPKKCGRVGEQASKSKGPEFLSGEMKTFRK